MNTSSRAPTSTLTVIRWVARLGGLLFIIATAVNDAIVIAETVGGHGPNWATLSASEWATVVIALGLPLVTAAGVAIAWLWKGIGEGIGGALILGIALVAMVSSFTGPVGGGVSIAAGSIPMLLVGVGFLYCWWETRRSHLQQAGYSAS